ncbi:MAG: TIGR04282 family arsenosugar biosynthesis glycosyltransferase [Ktedonobacterales bacterium]
MGQQSDALVIFAKYPEPGKVKTRLGRDIGNERAAELYRAFLLDLAERFTPAPNSDGYDTLWARAPGEGSLAEIVGKEAPIFPQRGESLGDRLYLAAEDVRQLGYRRMIVVGSDAPHLPVAYVCEAFTLLTTSDAVFGPAQDGGYYLAGLHVRPELADLFRGIEMSTPSVLADTLRRTRDLGMRAALLPALFDVDEITEVQRLAGLLKSGTEFAAPHTHAALRRLNLLG